VEGVCFYGWVSDYSIEGRKRDFYLGSIDGRSMERGLRLLCRDRRCLGQRVGLRGKCAEDQAQLFALSTIEPTPLPHQADPHDVLTLGTLVLLEVRVGLLGKSALI